ncbi:MAG: efflux RND transporter periplasmic adaptor subunit [Bacillota bacterium]|nr:efflux RND transporter periplasmic adaptor subunit [Bacillota bacterium]
MKSKLIKAVIACVVAVAVGFGGYYGYKRIFPAKTVAATSQYYAQSVRRMNLTQTIQGTGAAYAASTKDVVPNNNGTLSGLSIKVGDTVTAGQTLFVASSTSLNQAVTTAQNNLTKVNLTLTSDQKAKVTDDTNVANDKTAVSTAQAALDTAKANGDAGAIASAQSALDKANQTLTNDLNSQANDANKVTLDKLSVSDAQTSVDNAKIALNNAAVTAPIGGVVTAVNNVNGDTVSPSKGVLTIVDMTSLKVKVSVDELDIAKVQIGQAAIIKFDAISGKSYEGTVETIAQTGTTSNNVTSYDVVVDITDPTGIKLGMNGNITITTASKENALVIPAEALITTNGQKFVRVDNSAATGTTSNSNTQQGSNSTQGGSSSQTGSSQNSQGTSGQNSRQNGTSGTTGTTGTRGMQAVSGTGTMVKVTTGLETQNYIEVTEGLTEGQKVIITLPSTSSTSGTSSNNRGNQGGFGGGFSGGMTGGGMPSGGPRD